MADQKNERKEQTEKEYFALIDKQILSISERTWRLQPNQISMILTKNQEIVIDPSVLIELIRNQDESVLFPQGFLFANVFKRLESLEAKYEHGIRPALKTLAQHIDKKDLVPAASSAKYELIARLSKVNEAAQNMIEHYSDLDERLQAYVDLVSQLREVLRYSRNIENRYFHRATLMIYDALSCTYSEELTEVMVKTVGSVIASLHDLDWNRDKIRLLDKQLRACGFETVLSDKFHVQEEARKYVALS
jgi:hypothetical protein